MATIPKWLLGQHLTSVVVTPQSVSSAGVLSDGTAKTVTTVVENISLKLSPTKEEINAVNTVRENEVVISDGAHLSLSIIQVNNTADPSPLAAIALTNDVFKVVFVKGTATGSIDTWTGYFSRGEYVDGISGRGKQIASLDLGPLDPGQAQVARAIT